MRQRLDEEAFRHFAPLLAASQEYATTSGCRFRNGDFDGIPEVAFDNGAASSDAVKVGPQRGGDSALQLAAKLRAAPTIKEFRQRLRGGEALLREELDRAFHIVMAESVRNAMMGMFQALEMFPPSPAPRDVPDDDCAYEDVTAPLPDIAQRLYNDQARRVMDTTGGPSRLEGRALTAGFIVDFADAAGVALPETPATQLAMLEELAKRTAEVTSRQDDGQQEKVRQIFLHGLGAGAAAEKLRMDAQQWWSKNWKTVAWAAAGAAVFGVIGAVAAVAIDRRQSRQSRQSQ